MMLMMKNQEDIYYHHYLEDIKIEPSSGTAQTEKV